MIRWLFSCALVLSFPLFSESSGIRADRLEFQEGILKLSGQCQLITPFGEVFADEAVFTGPRGDGLNGDFPYEQAEMRGSIRMRLGADHELACHEALFLFDEGVCLFSGGEEPVSYRNAEGFELLSRDLVLTFESLLGLDFRQVVNHITANGSVQISQKEKWSTTGDRLLFYPSHDRIPPFILTACPGGRCTVRDQGKIELEASQIEWDGGDKLQLFNLTGKLEREKNCAPLIGRADYAEYHPSLRMLLLERDVVMSEENAFSLYVDKKLVVWSDGGSALNRCEADGKIDMTTFSQNGAREYQLSMKGKLTVDLEQSRSQAIAERDTYVVLKAEEKEISSQSMEIDFQGNFPQLQVRHMHLTGDALVRIEILTPAKKRYHQAAWADRLDFDPVRGNILLESYPPNRVLLSDTVNDIRASAPKLEMSFMGKNRPFLIRGRGDVRVIGMDHEIKQLFKRLDSKGDKNGKNS